MQSQDSQNQEEARKRSEAAALMGRVKSQKKAKAARENGKKGGRPARTPTAREIDNVA